MSQNDTNLVASIVIPVYNKEQFLSGCFETLQKQTLEKDRFEAIFVDDGSKDSSLALLRAFQEENPWVKVIAKENGGVCSARNAGIHAAKGKYIFYLDPDDEWTDNVLATVSAFFDRNYDKVDLVTYPIVPYQDGKKLALHYRYDVLTSTGIYNLNEGDNWLATQTTMNIVVKNRFENNHTFDFVSENGVIYHEDQQYISEILLENPVIGYCAGPEYQWNKNEDSVTNNAVRPYYVYNNTMRMYEHLYSLCDNKPPRFLQSLLVHDLGWKMRANAALPTHVEGEEYDKAIARLRALLQGVDDEVIMRHPNVHQYHRYYILGLKWGADAFTYGLGNGGITLMHGDDVLYAEGRVEVNILRSRTTTKGLKLVAVVKSPAFAFINEEIKLFASHTVHGVVKDEQVPFVTTSWGRVGTNSEIAKTYGFRYFVPFGEPSDTRFYLTIGGIEIPLRFTYLANRVNFSELGKQEYVQLGHRVVLKSGVATIAVRKLGAKAEHAAWKTFGKVSSPKVRASRFALYEAMDQMRKRGKRIWIYIDAPGRLDNAWQQFEHDCLIKDGVTRYYAAQGTSPELPKGATHAFIIKHGGRTHRFLHLLAEKVLCSDVSRKCVMPWSDGRRKYYADFDNAELVYLQHGVLWAHMPWYYSYDRILFDKEVVSTQFEIDNLTGQYGFMREDLIDCGMPRYDFIEHEVPAKKKILLCPSWRFYLISEMDENGKRTPYPDKFKNSNYFKGLDGLLKSERLGKLLDEYGYELVFKLHPNFACYEDCFSSPNPAVTITSERIEENEFAVIITDYSSYSFDFVYLKRALIYYITDMNEFRAGINNYNELDMPLDDALGEYARTADEAIDAIERLLKNDGKPLERYAEREKGFFLHYDNKQRDRLYQALFNEE